LISGSDREVRCSVGYLSLDILFLFCLQEGKYCSSFPSCNEIRFVFRFYFVFLCVAWIPSAADLISMGLRR